MLPDYPKTKKLVAELLRERTEHARMRELGPFAQISTTRLFEGITLRLNRSNGSQSERQIQKFEAASDVKHDIRDIENLTPDQIETALDQVGTKMAHQQMECLLQLTDEAAHEVGNVELLPI
jgi:hypothetical protein